MLPKFKQRKSGPRRRNAWSHTVAAGTRIFWNLCCRRKYVLMLNPKSGDCAGLMWRYGLTDEEFVVAALCRDWVLYTMRMMSARYGHMVDRKSRKFAEQIEIEDYIASRDFDAYDCFWNEDLITGSVVPLRHNNHSSEHSDSQVGKCKLKSSCISTSHTSNYRPPTITSRVSRTIKSCIPMP